MLKKEKLHLCCWGTYTLRGPILSPWRPKSVPTSSQFHSAVSRLAGQTAQAEALAAGQKTVTVYIDLHYQWSAALVWDRLVGEEYLSKTDPMRLGSEQLSEDHVATAPPSPNNCFSSYDTNHWSQIALFCIAAHVHMCCCITLQLLYLTVFRPCCLRGCPILVGDDLASADHTHVIPPMSCSCPMQAVTQLLVLRKTPQVMMGLC